ncbi:MAG TPA: hypothetical protein VFA86_02495 [Gammaproteobacteria bacterium]|nr:hypothetical protein [Gammaproteobacteria bacterium]
MIARHIALILYVSGAVTLLPVIQYLLPRRALKGLAGLELSEPGGLFFATHWGALVFVTGMLLIWAGHVPALRAAVVLAALVEKAALVHLVYRYRRQPFAKKLAGAAVFDGACVIVYGLYLLGF